MNVQDLTDPAGEVLWLSPVLLGRAYDLTVARARKIVRVCECQGAPVFADMAKMY
ncbi:hypothetical protein ACFWHF_18985 [Streptomyces griseoincarnatus]